MIPEEDTSLGDAKADEGIGTDVSEDIDDGDGVPSAFDEVDDVVLDALAAGRSHREAGALVGRSAKFVQRKLANPEFRAEVSRRRSAYLETLSGRVTSLGERAVEVLAEGLEVELPATQIRAAHLVLSWATRLHREVDLEVRLSQLEDAPRKGDQS